MTAKKLPRRKKKSPYNLGPRLLATIKPVRKDKPPRVIFEHNVIKILVFTGVVSKRICPQIEEKLK